jgi:hypothetical protein
LTPASGRQDHTTSPSAEPALSSAAPPASIASRLASVTIAIRPSVRRDSDGYRSDLGQAKTRIFLQQGLDRQISDLPVGHIMPSFMVLQGARTRPARKRPHQFSSFVSLQCPQFPKVPSPAIPIRGTRHGLRCWSCITAPSFGCHR